MHLPSNQPLLRYLLMQSSIIQAFQNELQLSRVSSVSTGPLKPLVPSPCSLAAEDRGRNLGRIYFFLNMVLIRLRHGSWRNQRFGQCLGGEERFDVHRSCKEWPLAQVQQMSVKAR